MIVSTSTALRLRLRGNESTSDYADVSIWGAQIETGSYPTSYIPTNGAAATRLADVCKSAGNVNTFNSSEGVLMAEVSALNDDLSERRFGISNSTGSNAVRFGYTSTSNRIVAIVYNGSNQAVLTYNDATITDFNKIAFKYKENDFALWVNGIEVSADSSGSVFTENTLNSLNFNIAGGSHFYGNTKQIQYFQTALTDSELEELTSWESFKDMAEGQNYTIK